MTYEETLDQIYDNSLIRAYMKLDEPWPCEACGQGFIRKRPRNKLCQECQTQEDLKEQIKERLI